MLSPETLAKLAEPIDRSRVTRGESGPLRGVNYLETYDVIERANELFGFAGWSYRIIGQPWCIEQGTQGEKKTPYEAWAVIAEVTVGGATYSDIGMNIRQGVGANSLEMAVKGAASDGVKRCLRFLGNQFGLSLYDKADPFDIHEQQQRPQQPAPQQAPEESVDPKLAAIRSILSRSVPAWAKEEKPLAKEATAYALDAKPSELSADIFNDYVSAWLEQPGNTPTTFQKRFIQFFDEEHKRRNAA